MKQIRCYLSQFKKEKKRKNGRKREKRQVFQRGTYLFPELRHRLGDHRMISYELSYELRRGEENLERKTEERQLAELDTV